MPLTTNDRPCNYFACKKNNEYLPVVYNGTFGAHHFCVEYLCAFVFIDIGTILLRLKIRSSTNTLTALGVSTFLFTSKVPLLTLGAHCHCRFVKEVHLCVCLTVSTRRLSNNIILHKKWYFTWQNCKHWGLSETQREYKLRFLPVTVRSLSVIVHQTLTSFFSKSLRKHKGTFGN